MSGVSARTAGSVAPCRGDACVALLSGEVGRHKCRPYGRNMMELATPEDYRKLYKEELVQRLWLAQFDSVVAARNDEHRQALLECLYFRATAWFSDELRKKL